LVDDVLNARNTADGFLDELLQVKSRQAAGKEQVAAILSDSHAGASTAEMWMAFQVLPRYCAEILSFTSA
jgi:hypothetical protein